MPKTAFVGHLPPSPSPSRRSLPAADSVWRDVLDTPATKSPLASRALLNGLANAGTRIVAVGQRGHVLLSDDSGKSWQQADVPVSSDLVAVSFPSASTGWAVGHDGVVLRSDRRRRHLDTCSSTAAGRRADGRLLHARGRERARRPEARRGLLQEAERFAAQGAENPFLDVWFENDNDRLRGRRLRPDPAHHRRRRQLGAAGCTPSTTRRRCTCTRCAAVGGEVYIAGEQGLLLKLDRDARGASAPLELPYKGTLFGVIGNDAQSCSCTACAAPCCAAPTAAAAGSRSTPACRSA